MLARSLALTALVAIQLVGPTSTAQAGPLIDWLFGMRRQAPAYPVGAPVPLGNGYGTAAGYAPGYAGYPAAASGYPSYAAGYPGYSAAYPGYSTGYPGYATGSYSAGYAPFGMNANPGYAANLGTYYGSQLPVIGPSGAGYSAQMPTGIAAATLPQTYSYVPNYNSSALRAPVTYYRPLLTTDPNTGSQVVAMAPCTSYQYLTQRVPALGQSALYGSYQAPQPLPMQSIPSYTLPSGGIPLANSSIGSPTASGGTALGYSPYSSSPYSSYQVSPPAVSSSPTYPTTPLGSNYYNNTASGGSTGSIYSQSVPGLVAPPAATYSAPSSQPSYAQPGYSQPSYTQPTLPAPSTTAPGLSTAPGSVMPPPSSSFSDPGNSPPSLPPTGTLRPRIQSILPEASPSGSESAAKSRSQERTMLSEPNSRDVPVMNPIPAPEGMEKPTWSPGLLRNEDMTALRPVNRSVQLAGQSKKIHWASFEQELTLGEASSSSNYNSHSTQLRPQSTNTQSTDSINQPLRLLPAPTASSQAPAAKQHDSNGKNYYGTNGKQYDTSGWKASR